VTHRNDTACWTTAAIFVVLSLLVPYIARASPIGASQPIRFAPNANSVTISGGVVRGARDLYHLDARSGDRLNVTIKAPAESAVFQLYRPGYTLTSDGAITAIKGEALIGAGETDDARAWTGPLSSRQCWYGAVCCLLLRLRNGPRPRARSPPSRPGGSPSSMPPPRPAGTGAAFRHTQIRSPGASTRHPPPTHNRIIQGKMRSARCLLRGDPPWPSA
jgi:hypothetical protein